MPEGIGLFRWKIQRIRQAESLPEAPEGMKWEQNEETKEWKLVPAANNTEEEQVKETQEELFLHEEAPRLLVQGGPLIVDQIDGESKTGEGDDWSLLSGQMSSGSFGGVAIVVPRGGSCSNFSVASLDSASANLALPYRLQRTNSWSTIDSTEGTLSSQVTGILGVDYVEHVILPTDTFQGICLAYKISATRLRQVNHFSGSNLSNAPKKLIIPLTKKALRSGFIRVQDKESHEYKLHALIAEVPGLKEKDARGYLEQADWVLEDAMQSAWEDSEWKEEDVKGQKTGGDICIKVSMKNGVPVGFRAQGAGDTVPYGKFDNGRMESVASGVDMTIYEEVPTSVSKNMSSDDLFKAAPQHNAFGVEMKDISKKPAPPSQT
jgi:hypothetical protein